MDIMGGLLMGLCILLMIGAIALFPIPAAIICSVGLAALAWFVFVFDIKE